MEHGTHGGWGVVGLHEKWNMLCVRGGVMLTKVKKTSIGYLKKNPTNDFFTSSKKKICFFLFPHVCWLSALVASDVSGWPSGVG